jgi:phosphoenolpyruvate carboxylase
MSIDPLTHRDIDLVSTTSNQPMKKMDIYVNRQRVPTARDVHRYLIVMKIAEDQESVLRHEQGHQAHRQVPSSLENAQQKLGEKPVHIRDLHPEVEFQSYRPQYLEN